MKHIYLLLSLFYISCSDPTALDIDDVDLVVGQSMRVRNDGGTVVSEVKLVAVLEKDSYETTIDNVLPFSKSSLHLLSNTVTNGYITGSFFADSSRVDIFVGDLGKHTEIVINGQTYYVE